MVYVLDTNVISELRKARSGKADPAVTNWVAEAHRETLFVSAITMHELEYGVLLALRTDARKGALLRQWLDESVTAVFADRVLVVDDAVARRAAGLHVPDPAPIRDALIGATALVRGMAVVTRNERDFVRFDDLEVINPWQQ